MDMNHRNQFILLRGLARESRHWGRFGDQLSQAMGPGTLVESIDLPGTGRYSEMRSPLSISDITEFVRAKYLELRSRQRDKGEEPAPRTHLVAISLGGMVASDWIERWREDFSSCVLINSSFRGLSSVRERLRTEAYWHIFNAARSSDVRDREAHILRMVSNRPDVRAQVLEEWTAIQLSRPVRIENVIRQLTAAARYVTAATMPSVPTLILASANDRMVDPSCSRAIAAHWQTECEMHPTAGHELVLDEPEWVIDRLRHFHARIFADERSNVPSQG